MRNTRLAVVGAGLIGQRHATAVGVAKSVELACIVDPDPAAESLAAGLDVPHFPDLDAMLAAGAGAVEGVILATPNRMHAQGGLACIAAGLPVLVEKPLTTDVAEGRELLEAAEAAGVPVATGHHRRHNPLIARARALVDEGALGRIAAVHAMLWLMKPDDYFAAAWRSQAGGGPIQINLNHEIDLLRHLLGPVARVQAVTANAVRGFEVEDTAVVLLTFESGVLGTINLCDTAVAPWSWELTARENPAYPATGESCCWIAGTHGSLSLPDLTLWTQSGKRSWWEPIGATRMPFDFTDPLVLQAEQFGRVVRGEENPLVSGRDGLAAIAVIEAISRSAETGRPVEVRA